MLKLMLLPISLTLLVACTGAEPAKPARNLAVAKACNVAAEPCRAVSEQEVVTLRLGPGVKLLAPFPIELQLENIDAESVTIDFDMLDMDMGSNSYRLIQRGGVWRGQAILPVCIAGRADWIADVDVETAQEVLRARFIFETGP